MNIQQIIKRKGKDWEYLEEKKKLVRPLVLVFGDRLLLEDENVYADVKELFPDGEIVFGSTCADITSGSVADNTITINAIEFEKTNFVIKTNNIKNANLDSFTVGNELTNQFDKKGLSYIMVISEGSFINGSQLTKGLNYGMDSSIMITGGVCGDAARFERTLASYNENPKDGEIVAIGFYGETFEVSSSIFGGWTPFGPERTVTKSKGNILYELDGKPALDLYKTYLGEKSKDLPGAALLFPLKVKTKDERQSIVRSILNIDEAENAMILAGDIAEGSQVQLMMTNVDNIANASEKAAKNALKLHSKTPELAFLVSCIGRKLVLDQRVEEEIEEVMAVLDKETTISGFYSYGEIAPFNGETSCQLHNQTMTVTLISE